MEKNKIKELLREDILNEGGGNSPHINKPKEIRSSDKEANDNKYDKIVKLLDNDIFNHAAICRRMKGPTWAGKDEATNRSLFRKKLKKEKNDDGTPYEFDAEDIGDIQKIMMGVSSTINHSIGRQGK